MTSFARTTVTALGLSILTLTACGGGSSPTAPSSIAAANWAGTGVQTLVSCSGQDCGVAGESSSGIGWTASWSGTSINFYNADADLFHQGTINGRRFVATISFGGYSSTLEGEFSPDYRSFEAVQTSDDSGFHWEHRHQVTGGIQ